MRVRRPFTFQHIPFSSDTLEPEFTGDLENFEEARPEERRANPNGITRIRIRPDEPRVTTPERLALLVHAVIIAPPRGGGTRGAGEQAWTVAAGRPRLA